MTPYEVFPQAATSIASSPPPRVSMLWQHAGGGASWLESLSAGRYKSLSMIRFLGRDWLDVLLACALFAAPWANAHPLRAEPLFRRPPPTRSWMHPNWQRLPPVDDFVTELDDTEELPIDLELEADEAESAKPKRAAAGMGGPFGRGGGPPIGYRAFGEPTVDVDGQPTTFEHWGQEISVAFPALDRRSAPRAHLRERRQRPLRHRRRLPAQSASSFPSRSGTSASARTTSAPSRTIGR